MGRVQLFETKEDVWEIINDDGFVYKRKKRRICPTTLTEPVAPPPPDPAIEEKNRRQRKKKVLNRLKEKYQHELSQWELLSNTLKTMQLKSSTLQQARQAHAPPSLCDDHHSSESAMGPVNVDMLDELLGQVEAQERVIQDASNLCDIADSLYKAEEKTKQYLMELPIWDYSPQELMASLCQD